MQRKKSVAQALSEIEHRINASELLTEEMKAEARERARTDVMEARQKKAVDAYYKAALKEEERTYDIEEQLEDFTIDLPEYAFLIRLNHVGYYHGVTYEVPYSVARSLADLQNQAWLHDREIQGRRRAIDGARQPKNIHLTPAHQGISAQAINTTASLRNNPRV